MEFLSFFEDGVLLFFNLRGKIGKLAVKIECGFVLGGEVSSETRRRKEERLVDIRLVVRIERMTVVLTCLGEFL